MSHFTKLAVQLKDKLIIKQICKNLEVTSKHVDVYENPWKASKEKINNCTLYSHAGKVIFAVDSKGNVIHDEWSMGTMAYTFMKEYSVSYIKKVARNEGATVTNHLDSEGNLVLEIAYA